jgi:hypothetical protein
MHHRATLAKEVLSTSGLASTSRTGIGKSKIHYITCPPGAYPFRITFPDLRQFGRPAGIFQAHRSLFCSNSGIRTFQHEGLSANLLKV